MTAHRWAWYAGFGGLVMIAWGLIVYHGLRDHYFMLDEFLGMYDGRLLRDNFPQELWANHARGPERLSQWIAAAVYAVTPDDTPTEFRVVHVVFATLYVLAAIPAYLTVRLVGGGRGWAVLAGALAVIGPSAIFGVLLLNAGIGYTTSLLLMYSILYAVLRPSPVGDAGLIAAAVLVAMARVANAPLVCALAPALLVVTFLERPQGKSLGRWVLELPVTIAKRHPVLAGVGVVALIAALLTGSATLVGGDGYTESRWGQYSSLGMDRLWDNAHALVARTSFNWGLVPAAAAFGYFAWGLVCSKDSRHAGLGAIAFSFSAIMYYTYALSFNEDRYFAPMGGVVCVGFACALATRLDWRFVAGSLVVALLAVATLKAATDPVPVRYILTPGQWYADTGFDARLPTGAGAAFYFLAGAALAALWWAVRGRRGALAVMIAGLALIYLVQLDGARSTMAAFDRSSDNLRRSFERDAFVDSKLRGTGQTAFNLLNDNSGDTPGGMVPRTDDVAFFNWTAPRIYATILGLGDGATTQTLTFEADVRTGSIKAPPTAGRYAIVKRGYQQGGFAGQVVASFRDVQPYVDLVRLAKPERLAYSIARQGAHGWANPRRPTRVRLYAQRGIEDSACMRAVLVGPAEVDFSGPIKWRLGDASGTLLPAERKPLKISVGKLPAQLRFQSSGGRQAGLPAGARIEEIVVQRC